MKTLLAICFSILFASSILAQDQQVNVDGAIVLGNSSGSVINGTIRYTGTDFQGYSGGVWQSLTGGGTSFWNTSTNGISYNNVEIDDSQTSGRINLTSSSHVYQLSPEGATLTMRDDNTYKFGYYGPDEFGPTSNNNLSLGSSTYRWSEVWSINPLNTASDRRLKKGIKPSQFGLNELLELEPVEYKWKEGHDKTMIGLIAQDVENIIPHVVSHNILTEAEIKTIEESGGGRVVAEKNKDNYSMSYSQLIPVLINAVKELNTKIEALEEELKNK